MGNGRHIDVRHIDVRIWPHPSHSAWAENIANEWLPMQTYGMTSKGRNFNSKVWIKIPKGRPILQSFSVEHVEPFTSKVSKRGKIVTIDSPKTFLKLRNIVGLTVTTSLGDLTVALISYLR